MGSSKEFSPSPLPLPLFPSLALGGVMLGVSGSVGDADGFPLTCASNSSIRFNAIANRFVSSADFSWTIKGYMYIERELFLTFSGFGFF